ncbi:SGNH/GDSL hydrolase family protein [Myxococcota bacterium]|nr:SGNH/GDSL hydrolase family protein [Myxococcota bacterium]
MPTARVRDILVLIAISLVAFVVIGEVTLRIYLEYRTFYDVEMSRYARLLKIDAENPRVGHLHRPNSEAELMDVEVRINSDGFRDDEIRSNSNGTHRIIFLGDSLTFGWGVEQNETFAHLLERRLDAQSPTEVINFGTGNYNTEQEVELLLEKGLDYQPDQVVLFYFINDAEPVPQKSRFPWLGDLRIATFYWSRIKALAARWSDSAGYRDYYSALYRDGSEGLGRVRVALEKLRDASMDHGFEIQVVLLPELHELVDYPFRDEHAKISRMLSEIDIPTLDLAPAFADVTNPQELWVAPDDAHPNAKAHTRIADSSFNFIHGPGAR